jgi:hypothetical protein
MSRWHFSEVVWKHRHVPKEMPLACESTTVFETQNLMNLFIRAGERPSDPGAWPVAQVYTLLQA